MRDVASYALIFYGAGTAFAAGGAVRQGRVAPAGGLALALTAITMILAGLGVLLGLGFAVVVAIAALVVAGLLAGYNAWVLAGWRSLYRQPTGWLIGAVLIALFIFGS